MDFGPTKTKVQQNEHLNKKTINASFGSVKYIVSWINYGLRWVTPKAFTVLRSRKANLYMLCQKNQYNSLQNVSFDSQESFAATHLVIFTALCCRYTP